MRKHIIFIALIHILLGMALGVLFLYGHYHFFSVSPMLPAESSISDQASFFQKLGNFYDVYMNYFAQFGINPLFSLFIIIISISFGYGLLKSKEGARKLGFIIIALNTISSFYAIFTGDVSASGIIQLGLTVYMWWILTSKETTNLLKTEAAKDSLI